MSTPELTLVWTYFNQPKMFSHWLNTLTNKYPDQLLRRLGLIVVDDCSTQHPMIPRFQAPLSSLKPRMQLLRAFTILDDITWNQMGARNLGVDQAPDGWLYCMDIDHVLSATYMAKMIDHPKERRTLYKAKRLLKVTGEPIVNPYNVFVVHKQDWLPHDESFRGHKGWSDVIQWEFFEHARYRCRVLDHVLSVAYSDHDAPNPHDPAIEDAHTTGVDRKVKHNYKLYKQKKKLIKEIGWDPYFASLKICQFNWREDEL